MCRDGVSVHVGTGSRVVNGKYVPSSVEQSENVSGGRSAVLLLSSMKQARSDRPRY